MRSLSWKKGMVWNWSGWVMGGSTHARVTSSLITIPDHLFVKSLHRRNKWCMKWRRPASTGSTERTLPAVMCGVWWVLAVTPGHNFYSAAWSQTASYNPKHQNHTQSSSPATKTLSHLSLLVNGLLSQTLFHLDTPTASYSGDTS